MIVYEGREVRRYCKIEGGGRDGESRFFVGAFSRSRSRRRDRETNKTRLGVLISQIQYDTVIFFTYVYSSYTGTSTLYSTCVYRIAGWT